VPAVAQKLLLLAVATKKKNQNIKNNVSLPLRTDSPA